MKKKNILESDLAKELTSIIVNKAIKKYKIEYNPAQQIVMEIMGKHPNFLQLLENRAPLKKILKSRSYEEVNNKARCKIYYNLRQYSQNIEVQESLINNLKQIPPRSPGSQYQEILTRLTQSHVSTKERLPSLEVFYYELFKHIGQPESIVDVCCGLHPLLFPFKEQGKNVTCYTALDKDKLSISAIETYAKILGGNILHALNWNIKNNWHVVKENIGIKSFDIAFLMKLIPVVFRTKRRLLDILLDTPAQIWVLTASKTSMTKYDNIERRERKIIHQFIDQSGKQVTGEFTTRDEFCIIIQ